MLPFRAEKASNNESMNNMPNIRLGVVAVSRDNFPRELSERRRGALARACAGKNLPVVECPLVVESEGDVARALGMMADAQADALILYLGNFGPETPETLLAARFPGPAMYIAAAEDDKDLLDGRGDAYCGLLNCCYNLDLRNVKALIPAHPVGCAEALAGEIAANLPVLRVLVALRNLKIITFGPRPQDFFACNAPIKPLYDLGIEIQENSELDLLQAYEGYRGEARVEAIRREMQDELKLANDDPYQTLLPKLARFEAALLGWAEGNAGARGYVAFANKCWPAFQSAFRFCPCYVNARLAAKGIPVGCETDIYGALSQYIGTAATGESCTLLDINNTVPAEMAGKTGRNPADLFMAFHCGNTPIERLGCGRLTYQRIMRRSLEPNVEPDITRGTLEGNIAASPATFFRIQATAGGRLKAYAAQGEFLDADCRSFGGIGMACVPEMERFYRYVLLEQRFPHHAAVAFRHAGAVLHSVYHYLGIEDAYYNHPAGLPYPSENPYQF